MPYSNEIYFKNLAEIIADELYIGSSTLDLQQEIRTNMWCISASNEQISHLTTQDFATFFDKVIENRLSQIRAANLQGMIFYTWFDEQASQIRFCLISNFHDDLPFGNPIKLVKSPDIIFEQFINSPYHDGIPFDELTFSDFSDGDVLPDATVKNPTLVYKTILT